MKTTDYHILPVPVVGPALVPDFSRPGVRNALPRAGIPA